LASLIRSFARVGGPTLQLNCVSPTTLREAQAHPEHHAGLIVRIAGLYAHFVALKRDVQDEIIGRALISA
jgi:pyruvate-formate lyase